MNKKIMLVLVLIFGFCLSGFAQQEPILTDEPVNEPVIELASRKVTAMEVRGNKAISSNIVISKMKTGIGGPYLENVISDDLKRLYLLGYFSDIKIDTETYNDGLRVIVTVVERPIIEKITFSSLKRIGTTEEKLKASLKSKETQYLDYPSLADDILAIKKMFEKKGYGQAKVEHEVKVNQETNKAVINFSINEGKRLRIKDILITGNKNYTRGKLLKIMKTKRAWFFNPGLLKEDVLTDDMERIKSFYHRQGYIDVVVDYEVKTESTKSKTPWLFIHINIREGEKYLVGNVAIKGNIDISTADILKKLKECTSGKVFSQEALKEDVANIQSLYFDRGYIACQIQESTSLNSNNGRIDITYGIIENQICYVDKIKIRGNIKTKDVVIRRELRIKPGDKFDGSKLKRSKERLQNLGFFDEISYDTEDTAAVSKKDLIVDVREAKTGTFSFGGGYSTVDQFLGFFEIEQNNFDWRNFPYFTGDGQNLKLRASLGTVSENFDLSFTEPWLLDYPVSFGFDAYMRTHDRESDIGYGYDEDVTGGDIRLGREVSEFIKENLVYRYDRIKITNVNDTASDDLKSESGKNNISSLEYGRTYDTRDNVFDTTKGNVLSGSIQVSGGLLGGNKDFMKLYGEASHYTSMMKNSVVEFKGRMGLADEYGDSDKVPIYERYFAGGANTIRGYRERKVGPIDSKSSDPLGGESMLIGNVWSKMGDIGSGGLKSGTGLGFRLKTPIGPLRLDYGIPMNKEPGKDSKGGGRFHFSMTHGF